METSRWQQVQTIFHAALEIDLFERDAWLLQQCGQDSALLSEVESLLRAHDTPSHILDHGAAQALIPHKKVIEGDLIGAWRVIRLIGEGGMGQVYEVARDDGHYQQRAALKIIDPSLEHPTLIDGFFRERQILAGLEHPQIARLLDGGRSVQGLPYLVMEYIEGETLNKWWATPNLSWQTCLKIFISICTAVDFAHRQLVVHRDLKPGNVLINAAGLPILLDFGIAKSLFQADTRTLPGELRPLTPSYASPEQLLGQSVGIASDIFALGIILYEMLSAQLPWNLSGLSYAERAQKIASSSPIALKPLAKLAGRGTLPNEIDWIVRRALHSDAQQRYPSVYAFANDLQAVLTHRPIWARPDSMGYRTRKWFRRHWATSLVGCGFLISAVFFVWQLSVESERTRQALDETRIERDRAEHVAEFLSKLFELADTTQSGGDELSARTILDRGREQLNARDDLPISAQITLLNSLASVYRNMGSYQNAIELLQQAQALLPQSNANELRAETLDNLGRTLQLSGQHLDARKALEVALAIRRNSQPNDALSVAASANHLAATLQSLGEMKSAGELFLESYNIFSARVPKTDSRRADSALRLGGWYWGQGQLDRCATFYQEALQSRRAQIPSDLPKLASALDANGALAAAQGHHLQAIPFYEEALSLRRKALGNVHSATADSLSNLGAAWFDSGNAKKADIVLREALNIYAKVLPPTSPVPAKTLNNLALVQNALGDHAQARTLLSRALTLNRLAYGDDHPRIAGNLNNFAVIAEASKDLVGAEKALRESIRIILKVQNPQHINLSYPMTNLGRILTWQKKYGEANTWFTQALTLRRQQLPKPHQSLVETLAWFGLARCLEHADDEGFAMINEAKEMRAQLDSGAGVSQFDLRAMQEICNSQSGRATPKPFSKIEIAQWINERGAQDFLVLTWQQLKSD